MKKNTLIAFSGIDGSGKSTLIKMIDEYMKSQNIKSQICRIMGESYYNKIIRKKCNGEYLKTFEEYGPALVNITYTADLLYNHEHTIIPAIKKNIIILSDRYDLCCLAYSKLRDEPSIVVSKMLRHITKPTIHFYLEVEPKIAYERIVQRSKEMGDKISEKENIKTLSLVKIQYNKLVNSTHKNVIIINSNREISDVFNDSITIIKNKFKDLLGGKKYG
ncbi:dTMP kinase [Clostridiaceae bacterium M8S5]|nr:dTMP kinase [Clostridiaceae bacterium M8S5]